MANALVKLFQSPTSADAVASSLDAMKQRRLSLKAQIETADAHHRQQAADAEIGVEGAREALDRANVHLFELRQQADDLESAIEETTARLDTAQGAERSEQRAKDIRKLERLKRARLEAVKDAAWKLTGATKALGNAEKLADEITALQAEIMPSMAPGSRERLMDPPLALKAFTGRVLRFVVAIGLARYLGGDSLGRSSVPMFDHRAIQGVDLAEGESTAQAAYSVGPDDAAA